MARTLVTENRFEFVIVAGARARQLLNGCTPKSGRSDDTAVRVAQKEVTDGKVMKVAD